MKWSSTVFFVILMAPPLSHAQVSRANGVNYDRNGNPVCSFGQLKSCAYAAAQGDSSAANYLKQRIDNNPNANKTTFYNYNPPDAVAVASRETSMADAKVRNLLYSYQQQQKTGICAGSCVTAAQIAQAQQDLNYAGAKANQVSAIYGKHASPVENYSYDPRGFITSSSVIYRSPVEALSAKVTPLVSANIQSTKATPVVSANRAVVRNR